MWENIQQAPTTLEAYLKIGRNFEPALCTYPLH